MNQEDLQIQLDEIADEFILRRRNGDSPTIDQFVSSYPEIGEQVRELLTTLQFIDEHKEVDWKNSLESEDKPFPVESDSFPQLDDFRIIRVAGRGGMGVVYEAEQLSLSRKVALKVLPSSFSHKTTAVERFQLEAKAAARLHHSHIVPVFEVGRQDEHCST